MTTIAATRTQIAADRQATHGSGMKFKFKNKIHKFEHPAFYDGKPFYVGLAGQIESFPLAIEYFSDPINTKPPKLKGMEAVILTSDGKIWTFWARPDVWTAVDQPTYAIGSGMHYASGALAQGATAKEAVQAACKLDINSGMGVTHYDL